MTTRRLSGVSSGSTTGPMIEAYDAFKKKHLVQNKEIIHKNSQLSKTNSELERTVTTLRAERLALKGAYFHLECENSNLRTRLQQLERELSDARDKAMGSATSGGGWDKDQIEMTQRLYLNALAALQALGAGLPTSSPLSLSTSSNSSPPPRNASSMLQSHLSPVTASPPTPCSASSTSSSSISDRNRNVTLSRRNSGIARAPRPSSIIHLRNPDLSHISEGGEASHRSDDDSDDEGDQGRWKGPVLDGLREEPRALASPSVSRPLPPLFLTPPPSSSPTLPLPTLTESQPVSAPLAKPAPKPRPAPPAARSAISNTSSFSQQKPARRISGVVKAPVPEPLPGRLGSVTGESTFTSTSVSAGGKKPSIVGRMGTKSGSLMMRKEEEDAYWDERKVLRTESVNVPTTTTTTTAPRRRSTFLGAAERKKGVGCAGTGALRALSSSSEDEDALVEKTLFKEGVERRYEDEEEEEGEEVGVGRSSDEEEFVPTKSLVGREVETTLAKVRAKRRATSRAGSQEPEVESASSRPSSRGVTTSLDLDVGDAYPSSSAPLVLQSNSLLVNGHGSEENDLGGRRARKSVNYALPKLNTKMRRPEDYVPVKATHPRKSVRPSISTTSTTGGGLLRTKSSLTNLRGRASTTTENQSISDVDEEVSGPRATEEEDIVGRSKGTGRRHTMAA